MNRENPPVTDEPLECEKQPVEAQNFRKITDHLKEPTEYTPNNSRKPEDHIIRFPSQKVAGTIIRVKRLLIHKLGYLRKWIAFIHANYL